MPSVPVLEQRTLRIDLDSASLVYQYEVCLKKFLGICTKKAMHIDRYDLTERKTREKLILLGFVAKVREAPK